jgi:hypothetical protein
MFLKLILGIAIFGTILTKPEPLQFIKQAGVVLAEFDQERETLTLNSPATAVDIWVCVRYEHGKTCKRAQVVAQFLLQDGQPMLNDTK